MTQYEPFYWLNDTSRTFLSRGYLSPGESAESRIRDIANHAQTILNKPGFADKFYHYMSLGWFSLSTPVWTNFGKTRGFPVSCFNSHVTDDVGGILYAQGEVGMMSKIGGGTSGYFGDLRPRGSDITDNGKSTGVVHFLELFQATTNVISQGSSRRGRMAPYLPVDHGDIDEFLDISSDNHPIQDMNHGVVIDSPWMEAMIAGDSDKRKVWGKLLKRRKELGYPYLMFRTNANDQAPDVYKANNKTINSSNLCVTGDTKILTKDGYVPIENLDGKVVECWNGRRWSKVPIAKTSDGQEVLKVNLSNNQTIEATPYHKWYVVKQDSRGKNIGNEMKRTFELKEGDKLIKFDLEPVTHGSEILEYAYENGFHTADGTICTPSNNARITLYGDKRNLLENFKGYYSANTDSSERINVNFKSGELKDKFFIPSSKYTVKSRIDWLSGLLDGDGTLTNNNGTESIQLCSVEIDFLKELSLFLQELGVDSKITKCAESGYRKLPANDGSGELKEFWCKEAYRILIAGSSIQQLIDLGLSTKRVVPTSRKYNRKATQFVKVLNVEDENKVAPTYCGNEPMENKLMFNGVLTGNCNEIYLSSTEDESFTCVLSSINVLHYDAWKDTDAVETLTYFLDAVAEELITKLETFRDSPDRDKQLVWEYMRRTHKFTKSQRALGLGVLGWSSLLQSKMLPFESRDAAKLNLEVFKLIRSKAQSASVEMASIYGEPDLLKGYGRRNTTLMAIAPTTSSAAILGQVSQSIEPPMSNYYVKDLSKVKTVIKNPFLESLLESRGYNTKAVWDEIASHDGSVLSLSSSILSDEEKEVFLTFGEINQEAIIDQAATRQAYIDQGQSLNLMIPSTMSPKDISNLHIRAWQLGLKGLYYIHGTNATQTLLRAKNSSCKACES